eukprot:TRINITY_DN22395_c0_g1_i1.p1 TRINITY_DN22395_c0_g1~~TRINITY_DN22395_c0_g1_i1.p1  ORF type:complete len:360 (+),score=24.47 TRINITY_DN22395_c0_g1_i1:93-1082(+)
MKTLVLSSQDVNDLLPMSECIDGMKEALCLFSSGSVVQPLRVPIFLNDEKSDILLSMPAAVTGSGGICGCKLLTIFHKAPDSHKGVVVLCDGENGDLLAFVNAGALTGVRTAACSGVATQLLARADKPHLEVAVLGTGLQSRMHALAMHAALGSRLKTLRLWGRNNTKTEHLVAELQGTLPNVTVVACLTAEEAVRGADVINTTTGSDTPIVKSEWVSDGAHINAVGACVPYKRELETALVARASLFADSLQSALAEAGEILIPIEEGALTPKQIRGEIGQILAGAAGRTNVAEVTIFKSLGLAVEDLIAARHVYQKAIQNGRGVSVDF